MSKETRPTLIFGKMLDLMDSDEGVALFYGFDQLVVQQVPRSIRSTSE